MKIRRLFLVGVVLLGFGLWLIFFYCHGTIGAAAGDAIAAFSIKVDMTTVGYPAIFGLPAVLLGSLLLVAGVIATVAAEVRETFRRKSGADSKSDEILTDRRESTL